MIYVSTGGFRDFTFLEAINILSHAGITAFELSGGRFLDNINKPLKACSKKYNIALHNYFPIPKKPFVLNLASFREDIFTASSAHIANAIDLSSQIGAKFYSFHAGYLIDPSENYKI